MAGQGAAGEQAAKPGEPEPGGPGPGGPGPGRSGPGAADAGRAPVTVVVRRKVKPGRGGDYEAWLERVSLGARVMPGYLGAEFHRPAAPDGPYICVFRFASLAELEAFERSDLRQAALAELAPLVEGDAVWDKMTGLEFWFDPPPGTVVAQPSRHRMALLLVVVVFVLVLALNLVAGPVMAEWPLLLRVAVTVVVQVVMMTYVVMPRLTRVMAFWIYPGRAKV